MCNRLYSLVAIVVAAVGAWTCSTGPAAPSVVGPAVSSSVDVSATAAGPISGLSGASDVLLPAAGDRDSAIAFPPRNEPFDFRLQLEAKYRDQLRRPSVQTFVDLEGDIVWIQEYLRYRLNGCSHSEAVARVLTQIDTGAIQSNCGAEQSGSSIAFPPRNEPFAFRLELEAKYRDGLRRGAVASFVDNEGDIVWTQEYIRYRVNSCGHADAVQRVFLQIDGRGVQPTCAPPSPTPVPTPTPTPTPQPPSTLTCGSSSAPSSVSCGRPTARCNDGSYSCSQNRPGTCSSHDGVSCWICPGPLC